MKYNLIVYHLSQDDAKKCLSAGMDRYLSKPVLPEKLIKTLASVFGIGENGGS